MINIAIIDDCSLDRDFLTDCIERYCQKHKVHVQTKAFSTGEDFLHALHDATYDIAFIDIYIGDINGLTLAEALNNQCDNCQIIFTTSSREHAIDAFRVHALDYLAKPYTFERLEDTLNRCETALNKSAHYIELKEGRHIAHTLISDIMYTDYYNHYIQVHTPSGVIRSYMPFADFAPMLEIYPQFLWCYRNCIINMDYIKSMDDKDFVLKNDERIPISRTRKNEIRQAYADYIFHYMSKE